jgi:hypothetical protein
MLGDATWLVVTTEVLIFIMWETISTYLALHKLLL